MKKEIPKTVKSDKRVKSTTQYMDRISERHSKVNIIRVDLAYSKKNKNVTLKEANKDLDHMFNNMRSKPIIFKDKVGHMCLREYTKDKGVHIHAIFLFDGQKVQKDTHKAEQIGNYWKELTKDKEGSFHNCHYNKYKYKGIGMLNHNDKEKRKIVDEHVISYLCKDDKDQDIEPIKTNKTSRAFTRGIIPKSKGNMGRPRKN